MNLPSGFTDMARGLLGDDAGEFLLAMRRPPVCSVRLNSRKPGAAFPDAVPVRWCPTGFYLPARPVFTLDPLLHAGAYYVQDASSMIYRDLTARILQALSPDAPRPALNVLDLCAAPGGKTTAMIDALPDGSRIIANEYVGKRAAILRENLSRWGYPLATVTNRAPSFFAAAGSSFDIVAVDAPCSGEGMMRKDPDAVAQWSMRLVDKCAALQRDILSNAVKSVKPGGFLFYSTCTFNRLENEANARFISDELGLTPFDPSFPDEWGIPRGIDTPLPVYRFMPHKTEGEGLFLAVFRKPGDWEPSLAAGRRASSPPLRASLYKGGGNISGQAAPPIEEILSVDFDRSRFPEAELDLPQAVAYLRREAITLPPATPKGIVIVSFKGLPLGPVKNIGARANNLYPKNRRIRL